MTTNFELEVKRWLHHDSKQKALILNASNRLTVVTYSDV